MEFLAKQTFFLRVAIAIILFLSGVKAFAQKAHDENRPSATRAQRSRSLALLDRGLFDVGTDDGLIKLLKTVDALVDLSQTQAAEIEQRRKETLARKSLREMTFEELKKYYTIPPQVISKKDRRGLKEIRRFAAAGLHEDAAAVTTESVMQVFEVVAAINNNHRQPAPPGIDFLEPPLLFWKYSHNPIAWGKTVATNLRASDLPGTDLSKIDPPNSTFWKQPRSIVTQDLYYGFGRTASPEIEGRMCVYAGPKTSYGGCPGFEVRGGDLKIKVKLAETTSEPFASRIFWALGYNVDPTDHVSNLKIKYDRRLLREFHLRKDIQTKIRAFGLLPLYTIDLQKRYDPFDFIAMAVLKDGAQLSGSELKRKLFYDLAKKHPEDWPGNFKEEVEQQIDYLITQPANIQIEDGAAQSIGPWDFSELGHKNLRELRAAGLLGAWIGWFDSRFDNTRLKIVNTERGTELKHFFTDLGGGLGKATGPVSRCCENPNLFGWTFTRPPKIQGKGRMTIPFRIVDYEPIEDTAAFEEMTIDDARWMARMIARLTEEQIVHALIASGLDSAQVKIYTEKLISRRDQMIRDLGLASEIAPLRPNGVSKNFSYDPSIDGPVKINTTGSKQVIAKITDLAIRNGKIMSGRAGQAPPRVNETYAERVAPISSP